MARETTTYWEGNKNNYKEGLYYSKKNGLYTKIILEEDSDEKLLFKPFGFKGYYAESKEVAEEKLNITIESNFGYGSLAYLRADIEKDNRRLLNFDTSGLFILNNFSIASFNVQEYDWDSLFEKIIHANKEAFVMSYLVSSLKYMEGLNEILEKDELQLKDNLNEERTFLWKEDFLVTLYAGNKIRDLLTAIGLAKITEHKIIESALQLCIKFLCKIKSINFNYEDSRVSQFSETLLAIHAFMQRNKVGATYMKNILT